MNSGETSKSPKDSAIGCKSGNSTAPSATPASVAINPASVLQAAGIPVAQNSNQTIDLNMIHIVAARLNTIRDVNEAIIRFLHTVADLLNAEAAAVRLLGEDQQYHLVASVGLDDEVVYEERVLPRSSCVCGHVDKGTPIRFLEDISKCEKSAGRAFLPEECEHGMVVVAITHNGDNLGVYNLWFRHEAFPSCNAYQELMIYLGRYLGLAIERIRQDEEAERLSVTEERTRLANELHDSLAQTMASVRFQVRVLDDTLHEGNEASLWGSLEKIENSLDEANGELRELIAHFRAPLDGGGVIVGVERAVNRFRRLCDIPIFFQRDWPKHRLPPEYELQVIRIVQESLANIRKHSQAKTVRVLLQGRADGEYRILIEDDGVGLPEKLGKTGQAGEHIGLSIMRDRAKRMKGKLVIDSDPGEGTRVVLRFKLPPLNTGVPAANG